MESTPEHKPKKERDRERSRWFSLSDIFAVISLVVAGLSYSDSRTATETSSKAFDVTTTPSLTLDCSVHAADYSRKAFSQNVIMMAPAGINASSSQADWSDVVGMKPHIDVVADQDVWACNLHSYSRLPLLNVALRFPLVVKDHPSSEDEPNYIVCLNEIPVIQVDGSFKFVLVNGSKHPAVISAPLPAAVTVPSVGRVTTPVILVGLEDPFKQYLFRPLPVGPVERLLKDAPISKFERLHCAVAQDTQDKRLLQIQEDQARSLTSP